VRKHAQGSEHNEPGVDGGGAVAAGNQPAVAVAICVEAVVAAEQQLAELRSQPAGQLASVEQSERWLPHAPSVAALSH